MVRLSAIADPYASVRVAVYEPILVKWFSFPGVVDLLDKVLERHVERRKGDAIEGVPTVARFDWRLERSRAAAEPETPRAGTAHRASAPAIVLPSARILRLSDAERKRRKAIVHALLGDPLLDADRILDAVVT